MLRDHADDPGLRLVSYDIMNPDLMLGVLALEDLQGGGQGASGVVEDQAGHRFLTRFGAQRPRALFYNQPRELRLNYRWLNVRLGRRPASDETRGNHGQNQP